MSLAQKNHLSLQIRSLFTLEVDTFNFFDMYEIGNEVSRKKKENYVEVRFN